MSQTYGMEYNPDNFIVDTREAVVYSKEQIIKDAEAFFGKPVRGGGARDWNKTDSPFLATISSHNVLRLRETIQNELLFRSRKLISYHEMKSMLFIKASQAEGVRNREYVIDTQDSDLPSGDTMMLAMEFYNTGYHNSPLSWNQRNYRYLHIGANRAISGTSFPSVNKTVINYEQMIDILFKDKMERVHPMNFMQDEIPMNIYAIGAFQSSLESIV